VALGGLSMPILTIIIIVVPDRADQPPPPTNRPGVAQLSLGGNGSSPQSQGGRPTKPKGRGGGVVTGRKGVNYG
jgi:hypothetical protein